MLSLQDKIKVLGVIWIFSKKIQFFKNYLLCKYNINYVILYVMF